MLLTQMCILQLSGRTKHATPLSTVISGLRGAAVLAVGQIWAQNLAQAAKNDHQGERITALLAENSQLKLGYRTERTRLVKNWLGRRKSYSGGRPGRRRQ